MNNFHAYQFAQFVTFPSGLMPDVTTTQPQSKENEMNEFYTERNHAHRAIGRALSTMEQASREKFHLDPTPLKDIEDLIARYNAGELTILPEEDREPWMGYRETFSLENPKKPADRKGHDTHMESTRKEYNSIELKINLLSPSEFEGPVQDFIRKAPAPTFH